MSTWIKRSLFVCLVFAATWVMFIVYWSGANHMPDGSDVMLDMLALPALFLLVVWGINKLRQTLNAAASARAAAAANQPSAAVVASDPAQASERLWTLAVAASAVRTVHGADADALLAKLQAREAGLTLDSELTDRQGFPILAGRIADLDTDTASADFQDWRQRHSHDPSHAGDLSDEQSRTLALAAEIVRELGDRLQTHPLLSSYQHAPRHQRNEIGLPQVHLLALWPEHWNSEQRLQGAQWIAALITQQGWPEENISVVPAVATEAVHPLLHLDRLIATSRDANTHQSTPYLSMPYMAIVVAAQSNLGDETVQQWEHRGQLLDSTANTGRSPGEAAAGLILADATQAVALAADNPVLLHRAAVGHKDKSADLPGRTNAELLTGLTQSSLLAADTAADAVALVVTDGDHRATRTEEIMQLGYAVLPEVELSSQCLKVAAGCGSAGVATTLAALVVAHAATAQQGSPSLCLCNDDAHARAAVVLSRNLPQAATAEPFPEAIAAQAATA